MKLWPLRFCRQKQPPDPLARILLHSIHATETARRAINGDCVWYPGSPLDSAASQKILAYQ
jgi:hypothetical protein